jgi:hypothetical protein
MNALRALYRRLDLIQGRLGVRLALSVIVLVACGGVFGSLIVRSEAIAGQRTALVTALTGQSLADRDEHAVSIAETGTVTVNGRTYGDERLREASSVIFDANGAILMPNGLAEALLAEEYPTWAPRWLLEQSGTTWMLAIVATAWLLLIIWMGLTVPFLLTALGTGIPLGCGLLLAENSEAIRNVPGLGAVMPWFLAGEKVRLFIAGFGLLTFTFVLLTRTASLLYERPQQILAIAHTVLKEASRTKLSLVFIILLLIVLPLIPLGLDPDSPLRFRIQTFISRSLGLTFYITAALTLVLSCATVAFEIRDRQIWQLVTKPVNRLNYLLGKWIGVITVNLIIMLIASVSIFTFVQYLREQPVERGVAGQADAQQVRDAVLTARIGRGPDWATLDAEQLRNFVEQEIARTPDLSMLDEVPLAKRRETAMKVVQRFNASQRTIPPQGQREYIFSGLEEAHAQRSALTLRYRFHILRDDEHETFPAAFVINQNPDLAIPVEYVPTMTHVLSIPSEFIRDDGTISLTLVNLQPRHPTRYTLGSLNFEANDFELLYKVGNFEGNFLRAVLIDWIKLSFLAMLGICCATFLNFSVSCLMSFTIFIAGTLGPYLAMSLQEFYPPEAASMDWGNAAVVIQWAFMSFIRFIANILVFLLEAFGEFRPTQSLVEGRLIAWPVVGTSFVKVGLLWSGLALIVGYLVLRRRQLAIYSGHG